MAGPSLLSNCKPVDFVSPGGLCAQSPNFLGDQRSREKMCPEGQLWAGGVNLGDCSLFPPIFSSIPPKLVLSRKKPLQLLL